MNRLDASGLRSPRSILTIRRKLLELAEGETLEVTADDPALVSDLPAFCSQSGHRLLMAQERDGRLTFLLAACEKRPTAEACGTAEAPYLKAAC